MMLLSVGAPETPAGGSSCSLKHHQIKIMLTSIREVGWQVRCRAVPHMTHGLCASPFKVPHEPPSRRSGHGSFLMNEFVRNAKGRAADQGTRWTMGQSGRKPDDDDDDGLTAHSPSCAAAAGIASSLPSRCCCRRCRR